MAENASPSPEARGGRLSRTAFDRLFREGQVVPGRLLVLRVMPSPDGWTRWGFGVSRRAAPSAVLRNRTRRRLRESARSLQMDPPRHIVVMTRREALTASVAELTEELRKLACRPVPRRNG